jgi:hypothetical protein
MRKQVYHRLTHEDRQAVSRWWRIMISATAALVLMLIAVGKAQQISSPPAAVAQNTQR